jgi:ABC-2 type transport system permease protein
MNLIPILALVAREVKRFQKIWLDTVMSPIMSMVLFLAVFGLVTAGREIEGIAYLAFVYTGLLTMTMVNASFSNPTFALVISKNVGTFMDLQITPVPAWGIGLAYAGAATVRAVLTAVIAALATIWFVPISGIANPLLLIAAILLIGLAFGQLGVIFGMYAKNFEALTFVMTFVIQPMIFLAGTFYPISELPGIWYKVSLFNPMHHAVNLTRYSITGFADSNPMISLAVMLGLAVVVFFPMQWITKKHLKG